MANTKISALTANTNPTGNEELVYAFNNANGKMTLNTMKTFAAADSQPTLVSGVNIKTINNTSILGSGNIDVSGGGGGGGFEPTELGGDANIWELSEGAYVTTYNLYYKTGGKVPATSSGTRRQMLFVTAEETGQKGYFVYSVGHINSITNSYASFGYSNSSSDGENKFLKKWDATFDIYGEVISSGTTYSPNSISSWSLTQVLENVRDTPSNILTISNDEPPYPGMTYTILVNSVLEGQTYSMTLGTGVTNPLGIALPTNTNKRCVITLLTTSTTSAVITGCIIEN